MREVFDELCRHDPRSTWHDPEDGPRDLSDKCFCDNCFYGRHKLALKIIELQEENEKLRTIALGDQVIHEIQWREIARQKELRHVCSKCTS